jgi:protein-tyrosine-phosphatase
MVEKTYNLLFLCPGNSARSILAEVLIDHWGRGRFQGYSAGSFPKKSSLHPLALDLLERLHLRTSGLRSKSWDEFAQAGAPIMDFVTVCDQAAGEVCLTWPGNPITAHWGVPDPAAVEGIGDQRRQAFRDAYRQLEARIKLFVALPIEKFDRMAIKREVDRIGRAHIAREPPR